MLILAVRVTIQPGHEGDVVALFRKLEMESRREPGCITYVVQRSRENPRLYLIYEQYQDEAALQAHRDSAHFKEYAAAGFYPFVEERKAEFFDPI